MSKIENAIKMILLLQENKKMSIKEISEKISVSQDMVKKYKKELSQIGFEIKSKTGKNGYYKLQSSILLTPNSFTQKEIETLKNVERVLEQHKNIFKDDFSDLKKKICCYTEEKQRNDLENSIVNQIKENDEQFKQIKKSTKNDVTNRKLEYYVSNQIKEKDEKLKRVEKDIRNAIVNERKVKIEYRSNKINLEKTTRIIQPYAMYENNDGLYVVAFCEKAREMRYFKLLRIEKEDILSHTFERNPKFDLSKYIDENFGMIKSDKFKLKLNIRHPFVLPVMEMYISHNQESFINDDKTLTFIAEVSGKESIVKWILSMGDACTVIEPEFLKEEIKEKINNMIKMY
ncbi:MAG: WYL domain-containing transcriptional regulator [Clostridioides sp.]|jgi:predicted DNA-binding transcriptional regulator YafY|nr:WYL domain-containing transcriptional regulator [Clostridioides sp.]